MFVQDQGSVKKELMKHYPYEDFSWIDDILPEEEGEGEGEHVEDTPFKDERDEVVPSNWVSPIMNVENFNVTETWANDTDDPASL